MLIRKPGELLYSAVTPRQQYLNRRGFLAAAGAGLAFASTAEAGGAKLQPTRTSYNLNEAKTPYNAVTTYNNYYEFGTQKDEPAKNAGSLRTRPWTVRIEGDVAQPRTLDIDAIMKLAPLEERIYRHRCVEGWSMVIPWIGFSLNALLSAVQPTSKARYVAFESLYDANQMPYARYAGIQLPYVEGLRIDEAMHPLAMLAVGLYGEVLPNQNGAPLRLVVPWKYGFKSIKSIVKIRLTSSQPPTTWNIANAREYGFYSNVNPDVDHPRWSQAKERRIGEFLKRPTLLFNGYGNDIAGLYRGLDLKKNY